MRLEQLPHGDIHWNDSILTVLRVSNVNQTAIEAAYGGVYVSVALAWLWLIDGQKPDRWDVVGVAITLIGMSIIAFAPRLK